MHCAIEYSLLYVNVNHLFLKRYTSIQYINCRLFLPLPQPSLLLLLLLLLWCVNTLIRNTPNALDKSKSENRLIYFSIVCILDRTCLTETQAQMQQQNHASSCRRSCSSEILISLAIYATCKSKKLYVQK